MPQFGQYETAHELSRGPFYTVSAATRSGETGPPRFAVKVCRPPAILSDAETAALLRQFAQRTQVQRQAAAASRHWAPIHEAGGDDEAQYAVTDLFETHAGQLITGRVHLEEPTLRRLVRAVVQGLLDFEQATGRPHGNLKPENVLLCGAARGGSLRVGLCDPLPTARDADPAADRMRVGELVYGLVMGRRFPGAGAWPLEPDAAWKRMGRHGDRWRGWCNRLLAPRGEESMELAEFAGAIDGLPQPRPRWRAPAMIGGAAVILLGGAVAGFFLLRPPPNPVTADWSEANLDAWLMAMDPGTLGAGSRAGWLHALRSTGPGAARTALVQVDGAWQAVLNDAAGEWAEAPKQALEKALHNPLSNIYQVGEQARAPEMAIKPRDFAVAVNIAALRLEKLRASIQALPALAALREAATTARRYGWTGAADAMDAAARGAVPDPGEPGGGAWLDAWVGGDAALVAVPGRWREIEVASAEFRALAAEFGAPAGTELLGLAGADLTDARSRPLIGERHALLEACEALRKLRSCAAQAGEWAQSIADREQRSRVDGEAGRLRGILKSPPAGMGELLRRAEGAHEACSQLGREVTAILDEQQRNATSIKDMIANLKNLPCTLSGELAPVFDLEKERVVQGAMADRDAAGAEFARAQERLQGFTAELRTRCGCLEAIDRSATEPFFTAERPAPRTFDALAAEETRKLRRRAALRAVAIGVCDKPDPAASATSELTAWESRAADLLGRAAAVERAFDAARPYGEPWPELGGSPSDAWKGVRDDDVYRDLADALAELARRAGQIESVAAAGQDRARLIAFTGGTDPAVALEAYRAMGCSGETGAAGWLDLEVELHGRLKAMIAGLPEHRERLAAEVDAALTDRWFCHARAAGSLSGFKAALASRAALERAGVVFGSDDPGLRALARFADLLEPSVAERDLPARLREVATLAQNAGLGPEGQGILARAAAEIEQIERALREDSGGGPRAAEVGPGAARGAAQGAVRFDFVDARESYALLRFRWGKHKIVFRALPGNTRYLSTDEVSLGLFMDLAAAAGASPALDELRGQHAMLDGERKIQGVRAWRWNGATMELEPTWVKGAAPDYYAQGGPPEGPVDDHPMHRLSPAAAAAMAELMGCRLPTVDEWKAAEVAARSSSSSVPNLRDPVWQAQQNHILKLVRDNPDTLWQAAREREHPWPDQDACMGSRLGREGLLQKGEAAKACESKSDGFLWFDRVRSNSDAWRHVVGNVAEYVRDGSAFRVIGGSALGDCQLMPREVPQEPFVASAGFSDVGFRLAFDVERALEERPTIAGAFDRLVGADPERLYGLLRSDLAGER